MKRTILVLMFLILVGGVTSVAFAVSQIKPINCSNVDCIIGILINIAQNFLKVVGVVSVLVVLYSGFLFMTSGGAEESLDAAKNYLKYGIIGLIVAALAFSAVTVVNSLLGSSGGGGDSSSGSSSDSSFYNNPDLEIGGSDLNTNLGEGDLSTPSAPMYDINLPSGSPGNSNLQPNVFPQPAPNTNFNAPNGTINLPQ